MTQKHTPEPWAMSTKVDGNWWHISAGNQAIAAVHAASKKRNEPYASMFEANARRIVACVNACAGWETIQLEAMELGSLKESLVRVMQQRDELLAAIEDFIKYTDDCSDGSPELDRARAAIKKITGETK